MSTIFLPCSLLSWSASFATGGARRTQVESKRDDIDSSGGSHDNSEEVGPQLPRFRMFFFSQLPDL